MGKITTRDVKTLYDQGVNVMKHYREVEVSDTNSIEAIEVSYDLQAGTYIALFEDTSHRVFKDNYTSAIAQLFTNIEVNSLLEAGVGEATTLVPLASKLIHRPNLVLGFDLSWSRLAYARAYARKQGVNADFFVGDLLQIPVQSDAIDVVYTSHSIEPNRGKEKAILHELYRIARKYVVLLEPSNELGSEATRARIEEHKYCVDLYRHATELGYKVIEHRLFDYHANPNNETALIVIEKQGVSNDAPTKVYACPQCGTTLRRIKGQFYCSQDYLIFPEIDGIACLRRQHGILGSKFSESISL